MHAQSKLKVELRIFGEGKGGGGQFQNLIKYSSLSKLLKEENYRDLALLEQ